MKKNGMLITVIMIFIMLPFSSYAQAPARIEGFSFIGDFTVTQGETFDPAAVLPTVNALLDNGDKVRLPVSWLAREKNSTDLYGYTEYDGFVQLPSGNLVQNEEDKTAFMRVYTARKEALVVRRVEPVQDIRVDFGQPENLIPFPTEVRVDLSNNTQRTLPIRFKPNERYTPLQEGAYQFIGIVDLPADGTIRNDARNTITLRVMVNAPEQTERPTEASQTQEALNPGIPPMPTRVPVFYYLLPVGIILLLVGSFYLSTRIKK